MNRTIPINLRPNQAFCPNFEAQAAAKPRALDWVPGEFWAETVCSMDGSKLSHKRKLESWKVYGFMDLLKEPPKNNQYSLHRFPKYWMSHGENEKKSSSANPRIGCPINAPSLTTINH